MYYASFNSYCQSGVPFPLLYKRRKVPYYPRFDSCQAEFFLQGMILSYKPLYISNHITLLFWNHTIMEGKNIFSYYVSFFRYLFIFSTWHFVFNTDLWGCWRWVKQIITAAWKYNCWRRRDATISLVIHLSFPLFTYFIWVIILFVAIWYLLSV